jgi:hypothetical protein
VAYSPTLAVALGLHDTHVNTLVSINSDANTKHTLLCWHSLATYLHELDSSRPLDSDCAK